MQFHRLFMKDTMITNTLELSIVATYSIQASLFFQACLMNLHISLHMKAYMLWAPRLLPRSSKFSSRDQESRWLQLSNSFIFLEGGEEACKIKTFMVSTSLTIKWAMTFGVEHTAYLSGDYKEKSRVHLSVWFKKAGVSSPTSLSSVLPWPQAHRRASSH